MIKYELIKEYREKIKALKLKLRASDYKALKFAEGEISPAEFEPTRIERRNLRAAINEYEAKIEELKK